MVALRGYLLIAGGLILVRIVQLASAHLDEISLVID